MTSFDYKEIDFDDKNIDDNVEIQRFTVWYVKYVGR